MAQYKLTMYETAAYRIRIQGAVDETWLQDLNPDWTIQFKDESTRVTTTITGVIGDQAALMGLLSYLFDVGLPLLDVECLERTSGGSRRDEQQAK